MENSEEQKLEIMLQIARKIGNLKSKFQHSKEFDLDQKTIILKEIDELGEILCGNKQFTE